MEKAVGHDEHTSAVCSLGVWENNDAVCSYKQYDVLIEVNSSLIIQQQLVNIRNLPLKGS